jgi:hypothetical protein
MKEVRQQLDSLSEARTRPSEVGVCVDGVKMGVELARHRARELD